jgi:hypothetical protein
MEMSKKMLWTLAGVMIFVLASCPQWAMSEEKKCEEKITCGENQSCAAPKSDSATEKDLSKVVATLGDKKLTQGEVDSFKKYFVPGDFPDERVINIWKLNNALLELAKKDKFGDDAETKKATQMMVDQYMASMYIRHKQQTAEVTDAEAKEYFEKHKSEKQYRKDDFMSGVAIAVKTKDEIDKLKKELVEGKDFAKLAEDKKEDTKKILGVSDIAIKEMSMPNFMRTVGAQVAYQATNAKVGEVIGPGPSPKNEWVLFKLTDRKMGEAMTFEAAKQDIINRTKSEKQMKVREEIIKKAEERAGVSLQSLMRPTMPPPKMQPTTKPAGMPGKPMMPPAPPVKK